ncbi:hypothetical protein COLO4_08732 [Corchorus olitorius]|uniref:Uncharacterized protein n=1 Tax=Corchorus olitorius TaxID=93759 RepID=A0A1R3KET3_9ROSI|nr:hypothetical protein COLO4_08732 [Corchorus olitorius]
MANRSTYPCRTGVRHGYAFNTSGYGVRYAETRQTKKPGGGHGWTHDGHDRDTSKHD